MIVNHSPLQMFNIMFSSIEAQIQTLRWIWSTHHKYWVVAKWIIAVITQVL